MPVCGMALAATPALTAPHTITVLVRGSMRRDSTPGRPVISGAEPVHQIAGQMRSRGVPALAVQRDLDVVGGRRDRPGPHRDPSDGQPRIAVQREDPRHPVDRARRDGVDRAAGHQLLGGLEDQPNTDRQLGHRVQRERRAEQHRGVRVVAAGVRDVGHHRGVGHSGAVGHRQRIHIGAQRDARAVLGTEVADQAGAAGKHLRVQPGVGELGGDELRGGELLAARARDGRGCACARPPRRRSGRPASCRRLLRVS